MAKGKGKTIIPSAEDIKKKLAEKAAEDEKKRKENERILGIIRTKSEEISAYGGMKSNLQKCKNDIESTSRRYKREKDTFSAYPMAKEVVVKNRFEGKAAKEIQSRNSQLIGNIEARVGTADGIAARIPGQESRLQGKIDELNAEIVSLRGKLR